MTSNLAATQLSGYFRSWLTKRLVGTGALPQKTILRTTFDPELQSAAEQALQYVFDTKVRPGAKAEAAIVVLSSDGAVRALVGGRFFPMKGPVFDRGSQASRQVGSLFKPFVYGAALDAGLSPCSIVTDEPLCLEVPGSGRWCPSNYTRDYAGKVTLTEAMTRSLNIPTVKLFEHVGKEAVVEIASDFGAESDVDVGPALALGVSESTLLEMTGAYAGILSGGVGVRPYGLVELKLGEDSVPLTELRVDYGERVITQSAAEQLTYMMTQVIERGTGTRARLPNRSAAGKTGTTQAARDAWFVGFTADYVAGVWMGNDDNTPLTGVTGGGLPAEVWKETMLRIHSDLPSRPLPIKESDCTSSTSSEGKSRSVIGTSNRDAENAIRNVLDEIFGEKPGNKE